MGVRAVIQAVQDRLPYRTHNIEQEKSYRRVIVLAVVANAFFLFGWAALTPSFYAPDENVHFNSIVRLEYGGGWPAPGEARLLDGTVTAMREASLGARLSRSPNLLSIGPPIWEAAPPENTTPITSTNAVVPDGSHHRDQMSQHSPVYYGVQAGLATITSVKGEPWLQQLAFARVVSLLACVPVPIFIAFAAREWGLRPRVSAAASFVPVAIPQFAFANGAVTNDAAAILWGSVLIWLSVRAYSRGLNRGSAIWLGVVAGFALLSKGTVLPVVAFSLVLALLSPHLPRGFSRWRLPVLSGAVALAVGGWWWVLNIVRYGELQPDGLQAYDHVIEEHEADAGFFLQRAIKVLSQTFYGFFGRLELPYSEKLGHNFVRVLIIASVVAVIFSVKKRMAALCLFLMTAVSVAQIMRSSWEVYARNGLMPGLQGRYLFASIVAICLLAAIALSLIDRWSKARILVSMVPLVAILLAAKGLIFGFQGYYQTPWETPIQGARRWLDWSVTGEFGVGLAVLGLGVAVLAGIAGTILLSRTVSQERIRIYASRNS